MAQTHLKELYNSIISNSSGENEKIKFDLSKVAEKIKEIALTDETKGLELLSLFSKNICEIGLDEVSNFSSFRKDFSELGERYVQAIDIADKIAILGSNGADILNGSNEADAFYAGDGNDEIYAGDGNDIINAGKGNDYINGGYGDDTYFFNLGDGQDTIYDYSGTDTLVFGEGIKAEDVKTVRNGNNLILKIAGTDDKITLSDYYCYNSGNCKIDKVLFADGTEWGLAELNSQVQTRFGTDGNDTVYGYTSTSNPDEIFRMGAGNDVVYAYAGNDTIYGEDGKDEIYAGDGNDIINAGKGNDYINGGYGDDTYFFNLGDGQDTIYDYSGNDTLVFGEGIKTEDVKTVRNGNNLILEIAGTDDKITLSDYYCYNSGNCKIDKVLFADGTEWGLAELNSQVQTRFGTDGNDTIYGYTSTSNPDEIFRMGAGNDVVYAYAGNDTIYGEDGNDEIYAGDGNDIINAGKGNDYINGGYGDDTYFFNLGDGQDTIYDYSGTDTLVFGEGIKAEDVLLTKSGLDLELKISSTEDKIIVDDFFCSSNYQLESFTTNDGFTLANSQINLLIQAMASFEADTGMTWEDAIAQNDETAKSIVSDMWIKAC